MKKKQTAPLSPGNRVFFREFYEQYKDFLFYIAGNYANSPSQREDLVQDALVRLITNADTLRGLTHGQKAKYIQLTVKAVWLDRQEPHRLEDLLALDQAMLEACRGPEAATVAGEAVQALREGISPRDWMALEGKYLLGYSHRELGELLDVDPHTLRSLVSRARKRAKKLLEAMEKEDA